MLCGTWPTAFTRRDEIVIVCLYIDKHGVNFLSSSRVNIENECCDASILHSGLGSDVLAHDCL